MKIETHIRDSDGEYKPAGHCGFPLVSHVVVVPHVEGQGTFSPFGDYHPDTGQTYSILFATPDRTVIISEVPVISSEETWS